MQRPHKPKTLNNLRIIGNLPIEPGGIPPPNIEPGITPPHTPKTPKSRNDAIGFIFGNPMSEFVPTEKPKKSHVIKVWMHLYDTVSSNKRIFP